MNMKRNLVIILLVGIATIGVSSFSVSAEDEIPREAREVIDEAEAGEPITDQGFEEGSSDEPNLIAPAPVLEDEEGNDVFILGNAADSKNIKDDAAKTSGIPAVVLMGAALIVVIGLIALYSRKKQ